MTKNADFMDTTIQEKEEIFVDLTYDAGFKAVFADEANKWLLVRLLNYILPEEAKVQDIKKYLDREQGKDTPEGKKTQFDIICEGMNGERFIVEFQRSAEAAFFQRCVYYAAGTYHISLNEKDKYSKLKPVYSIGFLNYSLSHEKPEMWNTNELISNYVFTEKRTGEIASPTISIIFVELERFTKRLDECTGELDQLLYLFRNISSLTGIPEEMRSEPFFEKLLNACRIAAFPENKKLNYELNMMRERDIIAQREYAVQNGFNNGLEKGREEGRAEGKKMTQIETAKNLLKAGVAPEVIADCVGLSLDFVKSL